MRVLAFTVLLAAPMCSESGPMPAAPTTSVPASAQADPVDRVFGPQSASFCDAEDEAQTTRESLTAKQLTAGRGSACVRLLNGRVRCWGSNRHRELPTCSSGPASSIPTDFVGLADAADVDVGRFGVCAVTTSGRLACSHPVRAELGAEGTGWIEGVERASQVTVGDRHVCVLHGDGTILCFGHADAAEALGPRFEVAGEDTDSPRAAGIVEIPGVRRVSAGASHTCALDGQGLVMCWGQNTHGQLGDPNAPAELEKNRGTPRRVAGLPFVESIDTSADTTCAISDAGEVFCWGEGFGATAARAATDAIDMGIGDGFICVADQAGHIRCFGQVSPWARPGVPLDGFEHVERIAVGEDFVCGLRSEGLVFCQGGTSLGRLGNGGPIIVDNALKAPETYRARAVPVLLSGTPL